MLPPDHLRKLLLLLVYRGSHQRGPSERVGGERSWLQGHGYVASVSNLALMSEEYWGMWCTGAIVELERNQV